MKTRSRAYHLKLANGQEWQIVSTPETESFVDKLAHILELEPHDGQVCPRLIVRVFEAKKCLTMDSARENRFVDQENLPQSGWTLTHPYYVQYLSHPDVPDVVCEVKLEPGLYSRGITSPQDIVSGRWVLFPVIRRALESGGLTFHAGLAEWKGMGILLAGRPNVGKSTACSRLPSPWKVLCDDEALVVQDDSDRYLAHPMPTWSNYFRGISERSWNIRRCTPLSAIFYLDRAMKDDVTPIEPGKAVILINDSARQIYGACQWEPDEDGQIACREVVFHNAAEIAKRVPTFILRLSLTGRFWEEVERTLSEIAEGTPHEDAIAG